MLLRHIAVFCAIVGTSFGWHVRYGKIPGEGVHQLHAVNHQDEITEESKASSYYRTPHRLPTRSRIGIHAHDHASSEEKDGGEYIDSEDNKSHSEENHDEAQYNNDGNRKGESHKENFEQDAEKYQTMGEKTFDKHHKDFEANNKELENVKKHEVGKKWGAEALKEHKLGKHKDKSVGHKSHGFKNVYHKEEYGNHKTFHDEFLDNDHHHDYNDQHEHKQVEGGKFSKGYKHDAKNDQHDKGDAQREWGKAAVGTHHEKNHLEGGHQAKNIEASKHSQGSQKADAQSKGYSTHKIQKGKAPVEHHHNSPQHDDRPQYYNEHHNSEEHHDDHYERSNPTAVPYSKNQHVQKPSHLHQGSHEGRLMPHAYPKESSPIVPAYPYNVRQSPINPYQYQHHQPQFNYRRHYPDSHQNQAIPYEVRPGKPYHSNSYPFKPMGGYSFGGHHSKQPSFYHRGGYQGSRPSLYQFSNPVVRPVNNHYGAYQAKPDLYKNERFTTKPDMYSKNSYDVEPMGSQPHGGHEYSHAEEENPRDQKEDSYDHPVEDRKQNFDDEHDRNPPEKLVPDTYGDYPSFSHRFSTYDNLGELRSRHQLDHGKLTDMHRHRHRAHQDKHVPQYHHDRSPVYYSQREE